MKSALKPELDNLGKALDGLENSVKNHITALQEKQASPQLDLSGRDENNVKKRVAMKLDQTIERLEAILGGEE
ncbi:MAG: hypothetical protein GY793_05560 [Proteobacteria bacterium]|nr:hypothetical protein [Pseudomonadota bacterium]